MTTEDVRDAALDLATRITNRFGWANPPRMVYLAFEPKGSPDYGSVRVAGTTRTARGAPFRFEIPVPVRGGKVATPGTFSVGRRVYLLADTGVAQALAEHDLPQPGSEVRCAYPQEDEGAPQRDSLESVFIDLGGLGDLL